MIKKITTYLENFYQSKYSFLYLIIFQFLFRLPYFFNSEKRMHGDEAFHWLVHETILNEKFILRPFDHNYIGVSDFLFVLPFIPFFGNTGLSNQLGLLIIYLLFAYFSIQITKLIFNELVAKITYYYFLIPSSFLMIMSATYQGGHFGSALLFLIGLFFNLKFVFENKLSQLFLSGIFFGLTYYNSHLNLIVLANYLFFSNLYLLTQFRLNYLKPFIFYLVGFLIGLIPEFIGSYFAIGDFIYNSVLWHKPFFYLKTNLFVLKNYGLDTVLGLLAHPFMRYYGFFYGELQLKLIHLINIFLFIFFIFLVLKELNPFKELKIKLNDIRFYFILTFLSTLILNFILILYINRELDDFGIRYLMPTVSISTLILFYFMSRNKIILVPFLIYFFGVNIFAYLQGYTRKGFYDFNGCPGSVEINQYFKEKKILISFANHWVSYNLMKNSKREHLSSPFYGENIHYLKLHDEIFERSKKEKIALVQVDLVYDWHNRHKFQKGSEKFLKLFSEDNPNLSEGDYKILEETKIDRWRVYILERVNL